MRSVESESQTGPEQPGLLTIVIVAAFFTAWSLLHVPIPGVNEPHYLCKARAAADPAWCARDFFLHSTNAHAVFFGIVGPLTQIWPLAVVAIVGRIGGSLIVGWGWCRLTRSIELSRNATICAAALLGAIALTGNFSGEWILGGVESKVPAFGFAFAAIASWMTGADDRHIRDWIFPGLFVGIAIALHPVVGCWFLIGLGMATVCEIQISGARPPANLRMRALKGLTVMSLVAFIVALPGLIPVFRLLSSSTVSAADRGAANRIQVFVRLKHHLDPTRIPLDAWIHATVLLAVIAAGSVWLWKSMPQDSGSQRPLRRLLLLLCAAMIIAAVGIGVGWHRRPVVALPEWSGRAFLLKFYPFRFVDALLPVTAALMLTRLAINTNARVISGRRDCW